MVKESSQSRAKIKRLFWDIETSPNVVLAFRAGYDVTINHDAVIEERKIICIGYKWEGEKNVTVLRWDKNQDDRQMLREFLAVANQADEMVHHHGDRFDMPWFRTRCLILGFEPIPPYKTIDTKAWASKYFYFNSNKLDYLSKVLGYGGKLKTDFDLWKDIVLHNCPVAMDKMCRYCGVDVLKLEKVFKRFQPYMKVKTHAGVYGGLDKWTCPLTGSTNVRHNKRRVTAAGTVQHQMQNQETGNYYTINEGAYKRFLAAKKKQPCRG